MDSTELKKIILLDDHQLILDGLTSLLENTDIKVVNFFALAKDCLNYLSTNNKTVNILISDIAMPEISGIEVCKTVKKLYPHIKVIMLSMYNSIDAIKASINAEADGFLIKNADKSQFFEAINKVLDGGTYFSEQVVPLIYKQMLLEKKSFKSPNILSDREIEILHLIAQEFTSDEIGNQLCISKKTVDNHRANMIEKTQCKSTIGLIKYGLRNGLINL